MWKSLISALFYFDAHQRQQNIEQMTKILKINYYIFPLYPLVSGLEHLKCFEIQ